jgi:hypothetical protein
VQTAQLAAILEGNAPDARRLVRLLDFLGVASRVFNNSTDLVAATKDGSLQHVSYALLAPLPALAELLLAKSEEKTNAVRRAQSLFSYMSGDTEHCSELLRTFTNSPAATLRPLRSGTVDISISTDWPELTAAMHGLSVAVTGRCGDSVLISAQAQKYLIESPLGAFFIYAKWNGLRMFFSCSSEIIDLDEPLKSETYDVKHHFLSVVPLLMYLKWAFQDSCWQANELGACLILDDPVLKMSYGLCDFQQLERQMREHTFSTNIAFIPWNWRRTTRQMAALVRDSDGRYSISVHGCDHTRGEFATRAVPVLHGKVATAKQRMDRHKRRTGISHDLAMIFPQGAFSRESLGVLQEHQFIAAVNTEVFPPQSRERITIADMWDTAILKYGSFPLFPRRYPRHGVENFAFDLLLGKPCLIVEHHNFFKDGSRDVVAFVTALNSLKCALRWRSLGDVLRRAYQWRKHASGHIQIRMFANELLLTNENRDTQYYEVEKQDHDSVGIKEVLLNGAQVKWRAQKDILMFSCKLEPGEETLIQVFYNTYEGPIQTDRSLKGRFKVALRRYSSELRDNFLARSELLMLLAQKAKKVATKG